MLGFFPTFLCLRGFLYYYYFFFYKLLQQHKRMFKRLTTDWWDSKDHDVKLEDDEQPLYHAKSPRTHHPSTGKKFTIWQEFTLTKWQYCRVENTFKESITVNAATLRFSEQVTVLRVKWNASTPSVQLKLAEWLTWRRLLELLDISPLLRSKTNLIS